MIAADEDALICDFAETYHIYDYRGLRPSLAATLAAGLRPDSRIKMAMAGLQYDPALLLSAAAVDRLTTLAWMQTNDGQRGRNRPASIVEAMTRGKADGEARGFASIADYELARKRAIEGM